MGVPGNWRKTATYHQGTDIVNSEPYLRIVGRPGHSISERVAPLSPNPMVYGNIFWPRGVLLCLPVLHGEINFVFHICMYTGYMYNSIYLFM